MYCERVEEASAVFIFGICNLTRCPARRHDQKVLPRCHMASSSSDASSSTTEPPPLEGSAISKMFDTTGNAKEKTKCEELVETAMRTCPKIKLMREEYIKTNGNLVIGPARQIRSKFQIHGSQLKNFLIVASSQRGLILFISREHDPLHLKGA